MRLRAIPTPALLLCAAASLLPGCVGGDAAVVQRDPQNIMRCFERSGVPTSPARGLLAEEADIGAVAVRLGDVNQATVVVEETDQAARQTARSFQTPVRLDPPRVRQDGSVVVVYDRPPQPREEQVVARCTGVRS